MSSDFLETIDPRHAHNASRFVDRELVVLGSADLFSVEKSDNEHEAVLSLSAPTRDLRWWDEGIDNAETLHEKVRPAPELPIAA